MVYGAVLKDSLTPYGLRAIVGFDFVPGTLRLQFNLVACAGRGSRSGERMGQQIVGLFEREAGVLEAARMLRSAGYLASDLDVISQEAVVDIDPPGRFRPILTSRLMQRPEGMWRCGLRWALIGTCVVEVPVLIWVLVAFDSWGIQVFLASTLWKLGTLFGGMLGAIVGAFRGLESDVAQRYDKSLSRGAVALVARVAQRDAPQTRGILIESGAYDIRNVEGDFISKEPPSPRIEVPERRDGNAVR